MKNQRKYKRLSDQQLELRFLKENLTETEKNGLVAEFSVRRADQLLQQIGFTPDQVKKTKWRTINTIAVIIATFLPWFKFWGENLNAFKVLYFVTTLLEQGVDFGDASFWALVLSIIIAILIFFGITCMLIYAIANLVVAFRLHNLLRTSIWNKSVFTIFTVWFFGLAGMSVPIILESSSSINPLINHYWGYWMAWVALISCALLEIKTKNTRRILVT